VTLLVVLQLYCFCSPSEASVAKKVAVSSRAHHLAASAPYAAPAETPCTRTDDFAEVGSEMSDSCLEAKVQLDVALQTATKEKKIVDTFDTISKRCATGDYNLECVSRSTYANDPEEYLDMCNAKMGPQATASGAVCRFAKMTLDHYRKSAAGYSNLVKMLKWGHDSCRNVPYECVANSDQCLRAKDIRFCFFECIKKGNMKHQMLTPPGRPDSKGIRACMDFSGAPAAAAAASPASAGPN